MHEVKKRGAKTPNEKALKLINAIEKGDSMILETKEWVIVTPPGAHILRRHLNREFRVEALIDDSGWKVTALS